MRHGMWRLALPALALLSLACASSSELARRSERAIAEHDYERAYVEARRALDKDSSNGRARQAMSVAATQLIEVRKQRIRNLAAIDTIAAANGCIDLAVFRAEVFGYGAKLPDDPEFATTSATLRQAAAALTYDDALASLEANRPKQAYRRFLQVRRFQAGYRDIEERIPRAYELAVVPVAVLPFNDDTDVPGLSRALADRMHAELVSRIRPAAFPFTRLIEPERIYGNMTVAQLGNLDRAGAISLGRAIGARQVVWGRYWGLATDSNSDRYRGTIYRKVTERDTSGKSIQRYLDVPFEAIERERTVRVRYSYEVIDTDDESSVARGGDELAASAHTVYTSYLPEGDCDAYCLYPPSMKAQDSRRVRGLEEDWQRTFGRWSVPKFLERARRDHRRVRYRSDYRSEFVNASADYPVFLDDLPSAGELTLIALDGTWRPVLDTLKELDQE